MIWCQIIVFFIILIMWVSKLIFIHTIAFVCVCLEENLRFWSFDG